MGVAQVDVFAFGLVVLELVTAKRMDHGHNTSWPSLLESLKDQVRGCWGCLMPASDPGTGSPPSCHHRRAVQHQLLVSDEGRKRLVSANRPPFRRGGSATPPPRQQSACDVLRPSCARHAVGAAAAVGSAQGGLVFILRSPVNGRCAYVCPGTRKISSSVKLQWLFGNFTRKLSNSLLALQLAIRNANKQRLVMPAPSLVDGGEVGSLARCRTSRLSSPSAWGQRGTAPPSLSCSWTSS